MKSVWFPLAAAPRGSDHDSFFILFYFRSVPIMTVGVFYFFFFSKLCELRNAPLSRGENHQPLETFRSAQHKKRKTESQNI